MLLSQIHSASGFWIFLVHHHVFSWVIPTDNQKCWSISHQVFNTRFPSKFTEELSTCCLFPSHSLHVGVRQDSYYTGKIAPWSHSIDLLLLWPLLFDIFHCVFFSCFSSFSLLSHTFSHFIHSLRFSFHSDIHHKIYFWKYAIHFNIFNEF